MTLQKTGKKYRKIGVLLIASFFSTTLFCGTSLAEEKALTLDESVRLALENNHLIEEAEANLELAKGKNSEVRRRSGLTLTFTSVGERIGGDAYLQARMLGKKYEQNYLNQLELTVPLYTGGELEHARKAGSLGVDLSILSLESTRQKLKEEVSSTYYLALQAQKMVEVRRESKNTIKAHLDTVEKMYKVGTVAKVDVLRSEVALADASQKLVTAENNYNLALASLNKLIGLPLANETQLEDMSLEEEENFTLEEATEYALAHRPEIFMANIAIEVTDEQEKMAQAGNLPKVQAILKKTMGGEKPFTDDHKNLNAWSVGFALKWNIFDQGVTQAKITQQKAMVKKAEAQGIAAVDAVMLDVRNAYLTLKAAKENIKTAQTALLKAEEDYRISKVRYGAGVGTNLDVMDAESALTATKTMYQSSLYMYNKSKASLLRAMGKPIALDTTKYAPKIIPLKK